MSVISELSIHHFRNFNTAELVFSPSINVITGDNGAGKSSILEAIHHLSTGQSYRTRKARQIICHGHDSLIVRAILKNQTSLAIQRHLNSPTIVKVNNQKINSAMELVIHLPLQITYDAIFQIIDCGSAIRRSFLDWGVFHLTPYSQVYFQQYKKALQQRNSLLKNRAADAELYTPWETALVKSGQEIHLLRAAYIEKLLPRFIHILNNINPALDISIQYLHGWGSDNPGFSEEIALSNFDFKRNKDLQLGFTTLGSHKADLKIYASDHLAKESLSRGQQKQILIALKLAQGELLSQNCLYLLDDLAAELDTNALENICQHLLRCGAQVIITSLDNDNPIFNDIADAKFSLDKGLLKQTQLA